MYICRKIKKMKNISHLIIITIVADINPVGNEIGIKPAADIDCLFPYFLLNKKKNIILY